MHVVLMATADVTGVITELLLNCVPLANTPVLNRVAIQLASR
jgi:hypothetical protein